MEYYLMRKDDVLTLCNFTNDGQMIAYSERFREPELMPPGYKIYPDYLKRWWSDRRIPLGQGKVEEMLKAKGIYDTSDYMLRNLGLSLTDYYWMKPIDSDLKWKDVNLFDNDFKDNILSDKWDADSAHSFSYSPNSSLKGELEKTWDIRNGDRVLIKGNHGDSSAESINEVIASEVHKKQGYDNYTEYKLLKIKGKPYDYGCYSKAFTNDDVELVSAHAIITSEKMRKGVSPFDQLIEVSAANGIDPVQFRKDLEYQILTDYLLTNIDRHMDNIGVLRDARTLKFIRMAPIFDTGRAFATGFVTPYTDDEINNIEVNSFKSHENELLDLVQDMNILKPDKFLSDDRLAKLISKDSKASNRAIDFKIRLYDEKKKRLLLKMQ